MGSQESTNTMRDPKVLSRDSLEWIFGNLPELSVKILPLLYLGSMTPIERVDFGIKYDRACVWDYLFETSNLDKAALIALLIERNSTYFGNQILRYLGKEPEADLGQD